MGAEVSLSLSYFSFLDDCLPISLLLIISVEIDYCNIRWSSSKITLPLKPDRIASNNQNKNMSNEKYIKMLHTNFTNEIALEQIVEGAKCIYYYYAFSSSKTFELSKFLLCTIKIGNPVINFNF